jgi:hypothetical protein
MITPPARSAPPTPSSPPVCEPVNARPPGLVVVGVTGVFFLVGVVVAVVGAAAVVVVIVVDGGGVLADVVVHGVLLGCGFE